MGILLAGILLSIGLELVLPFIPLSWHRTRLYIAVMAVITLIGSAFLLLARGVSVDSVLLILLVPYRCLNIYRSIRARMHARYLQKVTLRTSVWLISAQAVLGLALVLGHYVHISVGPALIVLGALQIAGALYALRHLRQYVLRAKVRSDSTQIYTRPTVSVLIPARNETDSLEQCLQAVVASDYPKLEILVLDDCSQTPRTPEIIRSFAHDGVRFIQNDEPNDVWLSKNQAYHKLAAVSSGEVLLFLGVDVRVRPDTISRLVRRLVGENYEMLSVMPYVNKPAHQLGLIQPLRYFIELCLPPQLLGSPAVLSTCWAIRREALQRLGGFEAVRRQVIPEAYFARQLSGSDE
ncbi:MAG TPA: glycosyltransferase family 2 protein, partial [Candidatus Limnocylindrales bacterium]|nr:glycosyltransferase family 2 protein [Candidatus Limnocylindrales bacterium]